MFREIDKKLKAWKKSPFRKPLILRGARQVGKTYSIKIFAQNNYKTFHYFDFERTPEINSVFEKDKNPHRILSDLELIQRKKININTDLLIFDEIQVSPLALSSLRYFYEEIPELHLISAGSLIEFSLKDISFPVGRVQTLTMLPMNFYEFLTALGNSFLAEKLKLPQNETSEVFHKAVLEELRKYFLIGGMPESVKAFVESNSYIEVFKIQEHLIQTYIQDFSKYAGKANKECLEEVFLSTAKFVGTQTKYIKLADGFSNPTIKNAYNLLRQAKVITKIPSVDPSGVPLGASSSAKRFKSLFLDIGLMNSACGLRYKPNALIDDLLNVYGGALAEQFVGQELLSANDSFLYYWSRDSRGSSAEVDYVVSKGSNVIPIEVKSGRSGKLKSMHLLLEKYPNIKTGYILSQLEYSELLDQKLIFMPIYYAGQLQTN